DVFQKVKGDFTAKGVAVPDAELRKALSDFMATAVSQIEAEGKAQK
ncbi:MAG TPA: ATPase inhibitor subunit zeta, partial [Hyphomicrobiaceae bacterium]|nr:ATPase inhibitor subunit zeta [Hyphomicrobiaceae bacterium]